MKVDSVDSRPALRNGDFTARGDVFNALVNLGWNSDNGNVHVDALWKAGPLSRTCRLKRQHDREGANLDHARLYFSLHPEAGTPLHDYSSRGTESASSLPACGHRQNMVMLQTSCCRDEMITVAKKSGNSVQPVLEFPIVWLPDADLPFLLQWQPSSEMRCWAHLM